MGIYLSTSSCKYSQCVVFINTYPHTRFNIRRTYATLFLGVPLSLFALWLLNRFMMKENKFIYSVLCLRQIPNGKEMYLSMRNQLKIHLGFVAHKRKSFVSVRHKTLISMYRSLNHLKFLIKSGCYLPSLCQEDVVFQL